MPLADQVGALAELQAEGKIRHLGLSKVSITQIEAASAIADIAAVQNKYHRSDSRSDDVLRYCEQTGLAFVPYAPLGGGQLTSRNCESGGNQAPAQRALGWLLDRSPVILPIPGTTSERHVTENCACSPRLEARSWIGR